MTHVALHCGQAIRDNPHSKVRSLLSLRSTAATLPAQMKSKKLQALQAQLTRLEKQIAAEREQELKNAHLEYGFSDRASLIKALQALDSPSSRTAAAKSSTVKASAPKKSLLKRRRRATITPEMKAQVKSLAQKGEATSAQIADTVGISLPSVQNIKKELGLVRPRKKS
jgi:hypothetical protein